MKLYVPRLRLIDLKNYGLPAGFDEEIRGMPTNSQNPEEIASQIVGLKQYSCVNLDPGTPLERIPSDVEEDILNTLSNDGLWAMSKGVPDLLCWNDSSDYFFIEVKSEKGTLRRSQIEWMEKFDSFRTYIGYVEVVDEVKEENAEKVLEVTE